jgi:hypothetical protein
VLFALTAVCAAAGVALSVYTVVPILTVTGWLMFGPRGLTSARVAWLSVLFPVCWLVFTLWVSLLLSGLAAAAVAADRRLPGPAL